MPFGAVSTPYPSRLRISMMSWVILGSSSTTKMRTLTSGAGEGNSAVGIVQILAAHRARVGPLRTGHRIKHLRDRGEAEARKLSGGRRNPAATLRPATTPFVGGG